MVGETEPAFRLPVWDWRPTRLAFAVGGRRRIRVATSARRDALPPRVAIAAFYKLLVWNVGRFAGRPQFLKVRILVVHRLARRFFRDGISTSG